MSCEKETRKVRVVSIDVGETHLATYIGDLSISDPKALSRGKNFTFAGIAQHMSKASMATIDATIAWQIVDIRHRWKMLSKPSPSSSWLVNDVCDYYTQLLSFHAILNGDETVIVLIEKQMKSMTYLQGVIQTYFEMMASLRQNNAPMEVHIVSPQWKQYVMDLMLPEMTSAVPSNGGSLTYAQRKERAVKTLNVLNLDGHGKHLLDDCICSKLDDMADCLLMALTLPFSLYIHQDIHNNMQVVRQQRFPMAAASSATTTTNPNTNTWMTQVLERLNDQMCPLPPNDVDHMISCLLNRRFRNEITKRALRVKLVLDHKKQDGKKKGIRPEEWEIEAARVCSQNKFGTISGVRLWTQTILLPILKQKFPMIAWREEDMPSLHEHTCMEHLHKLILRQWNKQCRMEGHPDWCGHKKRNSQSSPQQLEC